jgi:hypothetical protein
MRSLFLYTPIPELWDIFQIGTIIKMPSSESLYDLSGVALMCTAQDVEIPVQTDVFWDAMAYFLSRHNAMYIAKRSKNG